MSFSLIKDFILFGLFLSIIGFVLSSLGFLGKWKLNPHVQQPWYKDERIVQYIGAICLLVWFLFAVLFVVNRIQPNWVIIVIFLIFPLGYLVLSIYGAVLTNKKKRDAVMKKRVGKL